MPPPSVIALLALARRAAGGQAGFDADDLDDRLVRRHGLAPLAARLGVTRFRNDMASATLRARELQEVAGAVVAALRHHRVPVALIKGISYAGALYDHPGERPMTDVDLLVPGADFDRARHQLAALGLRCKPAPRYHHAVTFTGPVAEVDLHRSIMPIGWASLDETGMWARARPARERDDGALRLDPVDEALLQCLVLARGFWGTLLGYIDAARLLGRLGPADRDVLLERARKARVLRATLAALEVTARVAGSDPLLEAPRLHYPLPGLERIARGTRPGGTTRVLHRLGLCDGPREVRAQLIYYAARAADAILTGGGIE